MALGTGKIFMGLRNRGERVLENLPICFPHQVDDKALVVYDPLSNTYIVWIDFEEFLLHDHNYLAFLTLKSAKLSI